MLDCTGLACPQPVLKAKELVEQQSPDELQVLVDNQAASENVSRFLGSQGYNAEIQAQGGNFVVTGVKDPTKEPSAEIPPETMTCATSNGRQLVFIRSNTMGRGDDVLGTGLMKNFLLTLKEMGPELWRILFVNSGVKLCVEGAETLETVQELEKSGVSVLVCGTCLTHFDLLEQKRVGETTNMLDIVTSLQLAGKVITV